MKKPKLYKGLAYSFPEPGLIAFYVPNAEQGSRLYVLKRSPQTEPIAQLLKQLIDEATRPSLFDRVRGLFGKQKRAADVIDEKLGNDVPRVQARGRITKATAPEFVPDQKVTGGRVVKGMPRQLRKIKEGQEREDAS